MAFKLQMDIFTVSNAPADTAEPPPLAGPPPPEGLTLELLSRVIAVMGEMLSGVPGA